ncbi:MAG TPA: sugar ABC transporter ATP-binding protein [Acidobacteriota bacterium]|jgi:ABC-type sugar transport system ATPase subunit|nr:sugar ABC transporter ATP-binding protein [Acidobacteriota bacterium]
MNELGFQDIQKSFGAVRALRGVSFSVHKGEAHAVVGENGAGKSTLMKILAGILCPDAGVLMWNNQKLEFATPRDALNQGIGMVYQEMLLFPNLSVSENIFSGREITAAGGYLRKSEMRQRTANLLRQLHLAFSPDAAAESLSAAHQQLLQIARALAFDCRILILDEPTTCLTDAETADLFAILRRLRQQGVTLIYVSHKLPEVFRLCDRITVLRDGRYVGTFACTDTTADQIVRCMVGRELEPRITEDTVHTGKKKPLLVVEHLSRHPWFQDVSLTVHSGEIVGLFGLIGSGRSQVAETIFGLHRAENGAISIAGQAVHLHSPVEAVRAGMALVPEERHHQGLFFNLTLRENLLLPLQNARGPWRIRVRDEMQTSQKLLERWRIVAAGVNVEPSSLSGGNQQKVVVAKWLSTEPKLLLLDEPTKGVDVGAKYEIHEIIRNQAARGMGCLLISSELPEILTLAHRIIVLREGRIEGEVDGVAATEEAVMRLATRVHADEAESG